MKIKKSLGLIFSTIAILIALLVGVLEASGILSTGIYGGIVTMVLVVLGIIMGFTNIKSQESVPFMISALVIGGGAALLSNLPFVGKWVEILFGNIASVVIPAAIVVSLHVAYKHLRK